jgi:glutamate racemase
MSSSAPIGVFDSGVGGISVLRHLRALLPNEDFIYAADSGYAPYGDKPAAVILQRSFALSRFLLNEKNCKTLVVACNTATAIAASALREQLSVPIVAMEPAVKPAAAATRDRTIGILATVGTLQSARFAALLQRFADGLHVITQSCPGLVEQVERGDLAGDATRKLVEGYMRPLLAGGADTIVLGCTHYPFLRPLIEDIAGKDVAIIDNGAAVALQLLHTLEREDLLSLKEEGGQEEFWTSGDPQLASQVISCLWRENTPMHSLPRLKALANVATAQ